MTTVILAEKPSQARAYVEAFQSNTKEQGYYKVSDPVLPDDTFLTYGFGHLVELAPPQAYDEKYKNWSLDNLPIFPPAYKTVVPTDKKTQFKVVQDLLKKADTIVVATDSDREGENIAWSIMSKSGIDLKQKNLKRLWINSLESEEILNGFKNLKNGWDFYTSYQEAQTREISDWLVGMNASPLYTLSLRENGGRGGYSVGRVQTPTLYLVYKRQKEIANFKSQPYVELKAQILANGGKFDAKLDPSERFFDKNSLTSFMASKRLQTGQQTAIIESVKTEAKKSASPRLFSLSNLQSKANTLFKASAQQTLDAVQSLYEKKYLTYPRTDTNYITEQEFSYLVQNIEQYQKLIEVDVPLTEREAKSRYVNGKKVQEHHAIILTRTVPSKEALAKLPKLEQQIYDLVLKTTLAMFAESYEYDETTILTNVSEAQFKATGKVETKQGWKAMFAKQESNGEADEQQLLPSVAQGEQVTANIATVSGETQPPKPFTEGTLITAMKTAGKTLEDDEDQDILKETEGIGTEATRAGILEKLKSKKYLVTEKNRLTVTPLGETLCQAVELQPLLTSAEMTAKWEKALKQIHQGERDQDNFLKQIKTFIQKLVDEVPGQLSNSDVIQQQIKSQSDAEAPKAVAKCSVCGVGEIVDKGKFYGCTNYGSDESCDFTLPKKWSGKTLPAKAIRALVEKGETEEIKGFKSKAGKTFSAKLKLQENKLSFVFD